MTDQRLDASKRFSKRADPHPFQYAFGVFERTRFERNHSSESAHLTAGKLVLRMRFEPGIIDALDTRVFREKLGDDAAVFVVLLHSDYQRFCASQDQP